MLGTEASRQLTALDMDTDTNDNPTDQPQFACPIEKGEVSDRDEDTATVDLDEPHEEEQIYR